MSRHLQNEIQMIEKRVLALGTLVEDSVFHAVHSLQNRDAVIAKSIIDADNEIDLTEVDIEEECLKILALHQPVAHDLRFIVTVLKVNAELERIGDAAVNIAQRVLFLIDEEEIPIPFDFSGMAQRTQAMLRNSLDALVNMSAELAYEVIGADDEVDAINRQMYGQIERGIIKEPHRVATYIHLLGISRHIERMADHASNIAEDVIYLIDGKIIRHNTDEYKHPR